MHSLGRLARLSWFTALVALTGLTLAAAMTWLSGLAPALIGGAAVMLGVGALAGVIVLVFRAGRPAPPRRRTPASDVASTPAIDAEAPAYDAALDPAPGATPAADRANVSASRSAPLILLVGLGLGLLGGLVIARGLPQVSTAALAAALAALLVAIVIGVLAAPAVAPAVERYAARLRRDRARAARLAGIVALAASLALFAFTRYAAIADFPIYFFTDEAIHSVHAADLLAAGLRGPGGELLPAYFQNGPDWILSLSVYVHAVAVALFGQSVEAARLTSATFALAGALAVGLLLRLVFKLRFAWLGVLFLAVTPAWFLHSRTAFETALMVSCYTGFLLFYLLYRYRAPYFLYLALACGAATFYAYSNGQAVMLVTAVLLIASDLRYHVKHWRTAVLGLALVGVLALPYIRFRAAHPDVIASHLRILDSYLFQPVPVVEKAARFAREYAYGLSPAYWFVPNGQDLDRHVMKGYGHVLIWVLPFFVMGIVVCVRNFRSSMHRVVLVALIAAPFGSALVQIAVTRALMFVVPAAILCAIGFEWLVTRLRTPRAQTLAAAAAAAVLAVGSLAMWRDAVVNGPTWFRNYGLYGMQWGARQLLGEAVPVYLRAHPDALLHVSPNWSNGTDVFLKFFHVDPSRVRMLNIDHFIRRRQPLGEHDVFVMLPEEIDAAIASGKFTPVQIEQVIRAPDGSFAFSFARAQYSAAADALFAREAEQRRELTQGMVALEGEPIAIAHSRLDMGAAQDMFDGDTFTLARGEGANPFVVELVFPQPREVRGLRAVLGRMDFRVRATLFGEGEDAPRTYAADYLGLPGEPSITLDFLGAPKRATRLRLEIEQLNPPEDVHVHVRELALR